MVTPISPTPSLLFSPTRSGVMRQVPVSYVGRDLKAIGTRLDVYDGGSFRVIVGTTKDETRVHYVASHLHSEVFYRVGDLKADFHLQAAEDEQPNLVITNADTHTTVVARDLILAPTEQTRNTIHEAEAFVNRDDLHDLLESDVHVAMVGTEQSSQKSIEAFLKPVRAGFGQTTHTGSKAKTKKALTPEEESAQFARLRKLMDKPIEATTQAKAGGFFSRLFRRQPAQSPEQKSKAHAARYKHHQEMLAILQSRPFCQNRDHVAWLIKLIEDRDSPIRIKTAAIETLCKSVFIPETVGYLMTRGLHLKPHQLREYAFVTLVDLVQNGFMHAKRLPKQTKQQVIAAVIDFVDREDSNDVSRRAYWEFLAIRVVGASDESSQLREALFAKDGFLEGLLDSLMSSRFTDEDGNEIYVLNEFTARREAKRIENMIRMAFTLFDGNRLHTTQAMQVVQEIEGIKNDLDKEFGLEFLGLLAGHTADRILATRVVQALRRFRDSAQHSPQTRMIAAQQLGEVSAKDASQAFVKLRDTELVTETIADGDVEELALSMITYGASVLSSPDDAQGVEELADSIATLITSPQIAHHFVTAIGSSNARSAEIHIITQSLAQRANISDADLVRRFTATADAHHKAFLASLISRYHVHEG